MILRGIFVLGLSMGLMFPSLEASARKKTFKVATLAPEGSTWWKVFKIADKRLRDLSSKRMKIRLYAGGVAGDEPDVVRKLRVKQLHGAALTSVGLSEIQPAMLVLQAPGLFRNWEELDHVRKVMADKFQGLLAEKGYFALLWGDVGFNRFFSNERIQEPGQVKQTKPWCWTQDGVYQAFYEVLGTNPVLVGVPEVLPGLQTGLLNAYSSPPLAAVSLQWFNRSKYMLDHALNVTIGALVMRKKDVDELPQEDRDIIYKVGAEIGPQLAAMVREDNRKSVDAIRAKGIEVVSLSDDAAKAWSDLERSAADMAAGKVYSPELLAEVRSTVKAFRAKP